MKSIFYILLCLTANNSSFAAVNPPTVADIQNDANQDAKDLNLEKTIQELVMPMSALSVRAKEIKIGAHKGIITLTGVVATQDEIAIIERAAKEVAGSGSVVNNLTVAPPTKQ